MTSQKVLITGASSGIGRAIAFEFAARGFNLALLARNSVGLKTVQEQIQGIYKVQIETYSCDLSDISAVKKFVAANEQLFRTLNVLVHNAGLGSHGRFDASDLDTEIALATVQIQATLILTKALLRFRDPNRLTRILNVASVYSYVPVPFQAVYGACKAFMWSFADALDSEGFRNLAITTVFPGSTRTSFRARMGITESNRLSGMSAEEVAKPAVEGLLAGKKYVVTGSINKFFVCVVSWLPRRWAIKFLLRINSVRGVNR